MDPDDVILVLDPRDRIPPGGRAGPGFDAVVCPSCAAAYCVPAGRDPSRLRCPCGAEFTPAGTARVPETREALVSDEVPTIVAPPSQAPPAAPRDLTPEWRHGDTAVEPAAPRPASATSPSMSATRPAPGRPGAPGVPRFGKYEILGEVARGGMGVVYRAKQAGLNREVALKMLLAGEGASEEQVRRFLREAESAAKLSHPNIVPIYDVGVEDGKHYFAMEFIHGESAAQVIERMGMVPPRQALKIAREVALALQYAHEQGIVHRDIKPANIMLAPREAKPGEAPAKERDSVLFSTGSSAAYRVVVTDFGLAKDMGGDSVLTVSGTALGTPVYMSPEQADADLKNVGPRSDVYSLGAVLYEMVTGEEPFEGASVGQILAKVISQDPVPPRRRLPGLHRDVETIILTAMAKERERRYASAQAMGDDIERYLKGEAIAARPASLPYRAWKLVRRHKALSAAIAAFCAASIAWTAYALTRPGYLQLAVEPSRARVVLNGAEVRPDALEPLLVRPGAVRIRVEEEGYEAEDREIVVRRNETRELRVALRRQTGRLEVIAEPRGAVVELGGQEYGTPLRNLELPTGPVSFRLKADGSYSRFFDVRMERGKTTSVRGSLRPAVAWVRNFSTPGPMTVGADADGDGVRDLYQIHFQQILHALSGRTGESLAEYTLSKYLLTVYGDWTDVDGDGFEEYVAIRTMEDKVRRLACLTVRPGPDGKLGTAPVVRWETQAGIEQLGHFHAVFPGEGGEAGRVVFGGYPRGLACVSLLDGSEAWRADTRGPVRLGAAIGDADGDGRSDILVLMPGVGYAGHSSRDGKELWFLPRPEVSDKTWPVAGLSEACGPGAAKAAPPLIALPEPGGGSAVFDARGAKRFAGTWKRLRLLHGAKGESWAFTDTGTALERRDTATGEILWSRAWRLENPRIFETAADLERDGTPDLVRGREDASDTSFTLYSSGRPRGAGLRAINGATGRDLWSIDGADDEAPSWFIEQEGLRGFACVLPGGRAFRPQFQAGEGEGIQVLERQGFRFAWTDPANGTERWRAPFRARPLRVRAVDLFGDGKKSLLVATEDGEIAFLDAATGAVQDTLETGAKIGEIHPLDMDGDGVLDLAMHLTTGIAVVRGPKLLWSRKFTTTVRPAATIADADGDGKSDVLFPENPDGQSHGLYAFRGSDGAEIWHTRWSWQDDIILRPMALADADGDGKREAVSYVGLDVMAFKIPGGAQVADVPCGVRGYATPAVGDLDGDAKPDAAIAAWFEPMGIHAFSIADKRRLWHFPGFRIACFAGPTIADVDGDGKPEVLGASLGGTFACLDGRTGEPRWVRELGVRLGAEAVVADVTGDGRPDILLSCGDGTLRVFDGQGNEVQRAEKVTGPACVPALADADGDGVLDVVCGVQIGFCCVSFREGPRILWKFAARGKGGSSAAVGDLDGKGTRVAVFSPWDGFVYCVDLADGKERWRQRTGDPTVESSPQLGDLDGDGILDVVFGSYDCSLYAVSGRGMRR